MKYTALLLLVSLCFAQTRPKSPEETRLPNGRVWSDVIAAADHEKNLRDSQRLADLFAEIRNEIEEADKFVLPLRTLKKIEDAEKLVKDLKGRLRKN